MKLLIVWAVVALAAVHARTAVRQQSVASRITSLTDKDARQKARVHPAFANAGQRAGVEIWRINNFEPEPVPAGDFGKFYKGDSYIVLKTTADKRNNLSWDIHYWIGSDSSQDESGAAAILTVGLDDKFDGKAVQHRETMGYESSQFLNYFPGGAVRYLDGGNQSGFNHVTTNPGAEKRLFQVKGKKNVRVRQVDPLISSMNKGDVFILDINNDIFVYVGDKSKNVERLKAISVANQIRDQDHNGRGRVEIIDQYSSETDVQKFFTNLGSGSRDLVPEESAGGDDQTFEKNEESSVVLSEVSDSSGKLKITPLSPPFRQDQLKPQETYILDTVSGSIYVWVGKQATQKEKTEAMAKAQQYLTAKKYPSWVHVARIPQGTEPVIFKQYFSSWRDDGMSHSRIVRSVARNCMLSRKVSECIGGHQGNDDSSADSPTEGYSLYTVDVDSNLVTKYRLTTEISQKVMSEDKIYALVDNNDSTTTYWVGRLAPLHSVKTLNRLVKDLTQNGVPKLSIIKQGFENEQFLQAFGKWDPDMWIKQILQEQEKEELYNNLIDVY